MTAFISHNLFSNTLELTSKYLHWTWLCPELVKNTWRTYWAFLSVPAPNQTGSCTCSTPRNTPEPHFGAYTDQAGFCPCLKPWQIHLNPLLGPCTEPANFFPCSSTDRQPWAQMSVPALNEAKCCPCSWPLTTGLSQNLEPGTEAFWDLPLLHPQQMLLSPHVDPSTDPDWVLTLFKPQTIVPGPTSWSLNWILLDPAPVPCPDQHFWAHISFPELRQAGPCLYSSPDKHSWAHNIISALT